ncbi:Protein CROWDED NUCLEI 1 [Rhynchospora pubera]|uniref:Protein CROWDED NUCLEI 1 n=1 Tax=Rhynchospora pubera TaxID=906938 RepID=A0AAV8DTF2_9POAL|nr:Protein CROWDED NUCLEI 1 [Rhynchospora pubera]
MFTPQRKNWVGFLSPSRNQDSKGKAVAVAGTQDSLPPPPRDSLTENGGVDVAGVSGGTKGGISGGDMESWRLFRDSGMMDESVLARKDREALSQRITELDKELHEYQYNMGLLLIEKKEWSGKYEEIRQAVVDLQESLKQEKESRQLDLSEYEKREESLRKALGVEKQCVADLEKALREMRSEMAEVKFMAEKKLSDARALEVSLEEKSLEIEAKLHSADARLAEASRKNSQADRKLEEIQERERKFDKGKLSYDTDRKTREKQLMEQGEHLREWETKLQESQNRLVLAQRSLNERDERANEKERLLKLKQEELDEAKRSVETTRSSLKSKEDDINLRLVALTNREKNVEPRVASLERKEKELVEREEKLIAREKEGLQKLLEEHNAKLELKSQEFESELEKKRESFDLELKDKLKSIEKREKEITRREDQISKREQTLETKAQKLKEKELELQSSSKALKKQEQDIRKEEAKLSEEKTTLDQEKNDMSNSKAELERLKSAIEAEKQDVIKEREELKLTEKEREEHSQLMTRLKQEIEEYRARTDSVMKETEDLAQQKQRFETEWEILDEKRATVEAEFKRVNEERERFERWREAEERRIKSMEIDAQDRCKKEEEEVDLKKAALDSEIKHEREEMKELLKREQADGERSLQLRRHDLEMEVERRISQREKELQEVEKELRRKVEFQDNQMKHAIETNETKIQKIIMEREQLGREMNALLEEKERMDREKLEVMRDIESLSDLSKGLKTRREEYTKERTRFLSLVDKCKTCHNCGVAVIEEAEILGIQEGVNADLPSLKFLKPHNLETSPSGTTINANPNATSGGRMSSWVQKCSRIFSFSPTKNTGQFGQTSSEKPESFGARLEREGLEREDYEPTPVYQGLGFVNNSVDDGPEPEPSFGVADNSTGVDIIHSQADDIPDQNGQEAAWVPAEPCDNDKKKKKGRGRGRPVKRNKTIKAVVEDAKAILGDVSKEGNGINVDLNEVGDGVASQGDSVHTGRKRGFAQLSSEIEGEGSETFSESISVGGGGGRRKRRNSSTADVSTPGERRYNLRRKAKSGTAQIPVPTSKAKKAEIEQGEEGTSKPSTDQVMEQRSFAGDGVVEVHKFSHTVIRVDAEVRAPLESNNNNNEIETEDDGFEAVGGVPAGPLGVEPSTPVDSAIDEEDEEDDDEERQNVSIGKKLWNFLTT